MSKRVLFLAACLLVTLALGFDQAASAGFDPCLPECRSSADCNAICNPCGPPFFNSGFCELDQGCYATCTCFCGYA
jgi:hypothetical protein